MNEIPDNIEARLTAAVSEFFARKFGGEYEGEVFIDLLRDAILGERERCASLAERIPIAELEATSATADHIELTWRTASIVQRNTIAAAIRQGQAKEGEGA